MDKIFAEQLIEKTRGDYNSISGEFSSTRKFFWRDSNFLLDETNNGEMVLDLGCGNGRLFEALKNKLASFSYYGVDNSERLIVEAKKKYPDINFNTADIRKLPFEDKFCDKVYCIAVLHHIPSKELRLEVLREIKRVLKPGGAVITTVWNLHDNWQTKKSLFKTFLLKIFGWTKLDFGDIFVPWKNGEGKILAQRYVHVFTKKELGGLFLEAGFRVGKIGETGEKGKKGSNIYLVAELP